MRIATTIAFLASALAAAAMSLWPGPESTAQFVVLRAPAPTLNAQRAFALVQQVNDDCGLDVSTACAGDVCAMVEDLPISRLGMLKFAVTHPTLIASGATIEIAGWPDDATACGGSYSRFFEQPPISEHHSFGDQVLRKCKVVNFGDPRSRMEPRLDTALCDALIL